MKRLPQVRAFLLVTLLAAPLAGAQALAQDAGGASTEDAPRIRSLPPAYDGQMMRLAEVLGALHYLRALCGADEGQQWREQMEAMIAEEDPTPERRARLIARFNRGFRGYREVYRECTPAAAEAANRYRQQGIRLTTEIPDRFGN